MTLKLIDGQFSKREALDIITQLIHVKIKYHENKISHAEGEEQIKSRETRIKDLQRELFDVRQAIEAGPDGVNLHADIVL